jgi:hypothetical protein
MDKKPQIFTPSFGSVYPPYVQKAAKKGRTKEEPLGKLGVVEVIAGLPPRVDHLCESRPATLVCSWPGK